MRQEKIFLCLLFSFFCGFSYGQSDNSVIVERLNSLHTAVSLPYNDIVARCIQKIVWENKNETQKLLEEFLPYQPFFQEEILKAGLPQEFCYLPLMLQKIQQENKGAFYTAGAWNLPLLAAIKYGLTIDDKIDERCDIQKSTAAAISYLLDIQRQQTSHWDIILAYSNSLSALEAAKIRTHSNDIWTLYEKGNLPNKNCIPYFIAYTYIANFYESEQLKVNTENTKNTEKEYFNICIKKEDSLYLYSDTIKKTIDTLEKKNSISVSNVQTNTLKYHTVQSGEGLGRIAQKYGITVEQLKTWNKLSNDIIQIGQQLIVSMNNPTTATNTSKTPSNTGKKVVYIVKKGDTLGSIARKYNVSVNNLKKWNDLKNDTIGISQKLVILK